MAYSTAKDEDYAAFGARKELLGVDDVSEYLGVGPVTVYRWCREGRLPGLKVGKSWRIRREALDEFLRRVAAREDTDLPDATYHARVVMEVLQEAVAPGEIDDILAQLPDEYSPLFEAGSKDEMTIS